MVSNQARSLAFVDTEYSADSIEFCPFEGYQDIFTCGTYQVLPPVSAEKENAVLQPDKEEEVSTGAADRTQELSDNNEDESQSDSEVDPGSLQTKPQTQRTGRLLLYRLGSDPASL